MTVADTQPDDTDDAAAVARSDAGAANDYAATERGDELPAEYLRADDALLERTIELTEPYDPENTIET